MVEVERKTGVSEYHTPPSKSCRIKATYTAQQNDTLSILLFLSAVFCKTRWQVIPVLYRCLNVYWSCRSEDSKEVLRLLYISMTTFTLFFLLQGLLRIVQCLYWETVGLFLWWQGWYVPMKDSKIMNLYGHLLGPLCLGIVPVANPVCPPNNSTPIYIRNTVQIRTRDFIVIVAQER